MNAAPELSAKEEIEIAFNINQPLIIDIPAGWYGPSSINGYSFSGNLGAAVAGVTGMALGPADYLTGLPLKKRSTPFTVMI